LGLLSWGLGAHPLGIEDETLYFGFGPLGRNFLAIPEEGHTGGIANPHHDLVGSMD
jgi:hypothetical protein